MYNPVIQECLMLVLKPMHMYFCRMDFKTLEKEITLRKQDIFSLNDLHQYYTFYFWTTNH